MNEASVPSEERWKTFTVEASAEVVVDVPRRKAGGRWVVVCRTAPAPGFLGHRFRSKAEARGFARKNKGVVRRYRAKGWRKADASAMWTLGANQIRVTTWWGRTRATEASP